MILITFRPHKLCRPIGALFITGILGSFYTKRGGVILTFRTGIPGGPDTDSE